MIWENGIETCILSYVKQITSPGSMHDTGCLGLVHWDDPEGWYGEGGGFRMGNTCTPVADLCQSLPTKVRLVKAMVFPVVMYGCESWTVKKAERRRIDAFQL